MAADHVGRRKRVQPKGDYADIMPRSTMIVMRFNLMSRSPSARLALMVMVIVGLIVAPVSVSAECCDDPSEPPARVDPCCDAPAPAAPPSDCEPCDDDGPCDCGCPRCGCVVVKAPLSRTLASNLPPPLPASVVIVAAPRGHSHESHLDLLRPPRV